jgi:tungstate transport system substrate-binding protein
MIWDKFMFYKALARLILATVILFSYMVSPSAEDKFITVASTTSTQNSGLFSFILPKFEQKTGIAVRVVAVGTGRAIRLAQSGDVDVLFVHHKPSEELFVTEGYGVKRYGVMYNDFVIVGAKGDLAKIKGLVDAAAALAKIAEANAPFTSRADNSGTHKKEMSLWKDAGIDPGKSSGAWYRETGSGMGATLNAASAMGAYALADRGTWLSFKNRGDLVVLSEGDERLLNPYGVIVVNPEKFPHVKAGLAQTFVDWLVSQEGQDAIAAFRINGEVLFHPNG